MPRDTNIDKSATCLKHDFQIVHVPVQYLLINPILKYLEIVERTSRLWTWDLQISNCKFFIPLGYAIDTKKNNDEK